jgi:hypothetical protein
MVDTSININGRARNRVDLDQPYGTGTPLPILSSIRSNAGRTASHCGGGSVELFSTLSPRKELPANSLWYQHRSSLDSTITKPRQGLIRLGKGEWHRDRAHGHLCRNSEELVAVLARQVCNRPYHALFP